jgi:hypothetical protein
VPVKKNPGEEATISKTISKRGRERERIKNKMRKK